MMPASTVRYHGFRIEDIMLEKLKEIVGEHGVRTDVSAAEFTTFQTGGNVRYFVTPATIEDLRDVLKLLHQEGLRFFVIGNGSNVLVDDAGYDGVILSLKSCCSRLNVEGRMIYAGAAVSLKQVAHCALDESLTGFEFASGIPGSLGGAVFMNAGAYGGEMKQVLEDVTWLSSDGTVQTSPAADLALSYRHSLFKENGGIILFATIRLVPGDADTIRSTMDELAERRASKQPLELPSAGSTFKRPEGYFAGKLIMDSGLKGCRMGGAMVSDKHAGFIVNADHATATDIQNLIAHVQDTVEKKFGVRLQPEVIILKN